STWSKTLGFSDEELFAVPYVDFVHPEDINATIEEANKVAAGASTIQFLNRYRRKDGAYVSLQWTASPYPEEELIYSVARDVTQHIEDALRRTELATIVESSSDAMLLTDPHGRIRRWNRAAESMFGYRSDEIIGSALTTLTPNDYVDQTRELFMRVIGGEPVEAYETVRQTKNGQRFDVSLSVSPIRDANEKVIGVASIIRDISAQKAAEKTIRESEERYRDLFENANDLIQSIDADGRFLYVNKAWRRTLGYEEEDLADKTIFDIIDPVCLPRCVERFRQVMSGEHVGRIEVDFITKDGGAITVEGDVNCRFEDGQPVSTRAIFHDITERKKIDRMKDEFISTVSHELRTPLTSIRGSLDLILGGAAGELPDSAGALLKIARTNSERLVRLINDILDIEKIESGKVAFGQASIKIAQLVEESLLANRGYAEQYGVEFVLEDADSTAVVNGDPDRLMQVMANLLSNAAKFSTRGDNVTISAIQRGGTVRVSVTDTGKGIPRNALEAIFEKFTQVDSSNTRQQGGTGLGLSISKAIVEKHGGTIHVESELGVGSTFWFELPARFPAQIITTSSPDSTRHPIMLRQAGFHPDIVHSIADARDRLKARSYAAMTLDLLLPDESGVSFVRELRDDPATRDLPIIVVSAVAKDGKSELNGHAFKVVDWIDKPIDQRRLTNAVRAAVSSRNGDKPRILHVEDDQDVRHIVQAVLDEVAHIEHATTLKEAKSKLIADSYNLVLLDLKLPDGSGSELLSAIRTTPVVIFSVEEFVGASEVVAASLVKTRTDNNELKRAIKALLTN
ncbi:MAG: PAS domain S-box protein, partial [Candidatus Poribacteria bacterium]|nr:PAS domain S-box protein [Candidatus Poribacteria bacterium]